VIDVTTVEGGVGVPQYSGPLLIATDNIPSMPYSIESHDLETSATDTM
jgi:hypothetical protein